MKLLTVGSGREAWFQDIAQQYNEKINRLTDFQIHSLKPSGLGREQRDQKIILESKTLLATIRPTDFIILCDEKGSEVTSVQLAKKLEPLIATKNVVVVVGGSFGVTEDVKRRANWTWGLSKLTLSHLIAQIVILEQLYRAMTIIKRIPYHNE